MGKRITHQEFIIKVHNTNPTIEVIGDYIDYETFISVGCKLCGHKWTTRPGNISRGRKCPACNRFKPSSEFEKELYTKNNKITLVGKYVTVKQKVLVRCNSCNDEYLARPDILLEGMGCKKCANKSRRIGTEELLAKIKELHPTLLVTGNPDIVNDALQCVCTICGKQSIKKVRKLIEGNGCQTCFGINQRKSHAKFVEDLSIAHSNIIVLGTYVRSKDKILVRCTIDGYEWNASPNDLLAGYGCQCCASHGYNVGKTGYFYIYSFLDYCGFGITNTKKQRYSQHKTTFKKNNISAKLELIVKGDGKIILALEGQIKRNAPCYDTGINGFKKEAVLEKDATTVYTVVEQYLDCGKVSLEKI